MTDRKTSLQHRAPNRAANGITDEGEIRPSDRGDLIQFLDACKSRGRSPKTLATYREAVEALATFTAQRGMPDLESVRREHVESWLASLYEKGNKPATVKNRYASARAFFSWAQDADLRTDHPMARIPVPKIPNQVQAHYTTDEIMAVLDAIPEKRRAARQSRTRANVSKRHGARDRALLLFLLDSGVRAQEACDVRIRDIDREGRTVKIVAGKGGKGRVVRYSDATRDALNAYVRTRAKGGWEGVPDAAPLFADRSGEALTPNGIRMTLERRFAEAGVAYKGVHGMRRSFAISYLNNGGSALDLKELGGWESWSMVERYVQASSRDRALRAHDQFSPVSAMFNKGKRSR